MADKRTITVEMSIEDMGRISIALDGQASTHVDTSMYRGSPEWGVLQKRWDRLYKGLHDALACGVVKLDARP